MRSKTSTCPVHHWLRFRPIAARSTSRCLPLPATPSHSRSRCPATTAPFRISPIPAGQGHSAGSEPAMYGTKLAGTDRWSLPFRQPAVGQRIPMPCSWSTVRRLAASDPDGVTGADAALTAINNLVNAPGITDGVVVDVSTIIGVNYSAWDANPCDVDAANDDRQCHYGIHRRTTGDFTQPRPTSPSSVRMK